MHALLTANLALTGFMTGLIWLVQVVQYPGFAQLAGAPEVFAASHAAHSQRITWIVGPVMVAELIAAVLLALRPPPGLGAPLAWGLLALVGLAWVVTAGWSVPAHARLSEGFDPVSLARLIQSNWARTLAWSLRLGLLCWVAGRG